MGLLTTTAILVVVLAMAIAILPGLLLTDLPHDLTFNLTQPTTTMIITGANSGLGYATVQHFAHNSHATIIMACRSLERCNQAKKEILNNLAKEAPHANLVPMQLDLSDKSSMERFANSLQNPPVDILINNAGLAGATEGLTYHNDTGVENHIHVNHLGHVYLTHCLWNNLQRRGARIVVVSSIGAAATVSNPSQGGWYAHEQDSVPYPHNFQMYCRSKRANLVWAHELHLRYHNSSAPHNSISVLGAHPGFSHSDLCRSGCRGDFFGKIRNIANSDWLVHTNFKMNVQKGALSQASAAVLPPQFSGSYIGPTLGLVGEPKIVGSLNGSWHHMSFSREESNYLWEQTMKALNIKKFGDYQVPTVVDADEPENVVSDRSETEI